MMPLYAASKTFLCGEYAVLNHHQAILLATPPYFALQDTPSEFAYRDMAPASPAGQLYQTLTPSPAIYFDDPHKGQGGFGASSAQFVLLARYLGENDPWKIWRHYRQYSAASGADVMAQCTEGLVYVDLATQVLTPLSWPFKDWQLLLIRTGHKLATHDHLAHLPTTDFTSLANLVNQVSQALLTAQASVFLTAIRAYAQTLNALDLVAPHTQALLAILAAQPAILAAKGCGAMGADVILAVVSREAVANIKQLLATYLLAPPLLWPA